MKRLQIGLFLLLLCFCYSTSDAGKIYYWTDENGVRHFSNQGRPEHVEEVGKKPEIIRPAEQVPETDQGAGSGQTDAQTGESAIEMQRKQAEIERLAPQIEDERNRLQTEIDRIDSLMVGVSFTRGMIDNMRRPYQEQLDLLNADPVNYFEMKARGELEK